MRTENEYRQMLSRAVQPMNPQEAKQVQAAVDVAARVLFNLERIADAVTRMADTRDGGLFKDPNAHY
jgi:hypothetical protein